MLQYSASRTYDVDELWKGRSQSPDAMLILAMSREAEARELKARM